MVCGSREIFIELLRERQGGNKGMASIIIMPRQGQSVESCMIAKWHKKEGDPVQAGELLFYAHHTASYVQQDNGGDEGMAV